MGEDLYQAMSAILFKAQLMPEAEALMVRAAGLFPASKDVHFHLAQLYLVSRKPMKALEVFEQLSRMKAPRGYRSCIGSPSAKRRLPEDWKYPSGACLILTQAMSAYRKALEFTPDSSEARLGLGDVYLREGKTEMPWPNMVAVAAADTSKCSRPIQGCRCQLTAWKFP